MFTLVFLCLLETPMFTRVYLCLSLFNRSYLFVFTLFTRVDRSLHLFTYVYPRLLVFSHLIVFSSFHQFARACLHMCTNVYSCLPMLTIVYLCLPLFTHVYLCLFLLTCLPMFTLLNLCLH